MQIKVKRGTNVASKILAQGELGFATDVNKLYIGTSDGKIVVGPQQWGDIGGSLANQSDLVAVLANKIDEPVNEGTDGQVLITDGNGGRSWATVDSLPSQTGMSGKFLTTNGTTTSWGTVHTGASIVRKTYSELKSMITNRELVPGQLYRITDYVTITAQSNTKSAGNAFDLIVLATSELTLDCQAKAIKNDRDTYFSANNADLSKWQIWYDINNDTSKYAWADSSNGKGVIYRMIDEWGNECPYDFKNIQFMVGTKTQPGTVANMYYYTFSVAQGTGDSTITDHSFNGTVCYGNTLGKYIMMGNNKIILNFHVFRNTSNSDYCCCNTFGNGCYGNIFGNNCMSNTFGNNCMSNIFGDICNSNKFVNNCSYNIFGNECQANTFGSSCQVNTFGNGCYGNIFGNICMSNTFGNSSNQYGDYYCNNILENGCQYIRLYNTSTSSFNQQLQNITICQGVVGTTSSYIEISSIARNLSYQTKVAKNSNGELKIYCEADLIQ